MPDKLMFQAMMFHGNVSKGLKGLKVTVTDT